MHGAWSRRRFLALCGGAAAVGTGAALTGSPPPPAVAEDLDSPASATLARADGWTVITDVGAVGDGRSRPLSTRYRTLDEARRDLPGATSLADELDGAAIQSAIDSGADRIFYPAGRYVHNNALRVRSGQRHLGVGPGTVLANNAPTDRAVDLFRAHTFEIGNIHPVAMIAGDPEHSWATRSLAPIAKGARTVTLTEALGSAPIAVGDIVLIRSNGPPSPTGAHGITYDVQMWNRVVSWDPATARVGLELPVPTDVVAGPAAPSVPTGPTLCLNTGVDPVTRQPWSIVQNVEIGALSTEGAGFSLQNGLWRGWLHDLHVDGQNMITFNALVLSTVERVDGRFSSRMLEIKHASHDSTVRDVSGDYAFAPGVAVYPPISIGEQSYACGFERISCRIDEQCRAPVRALEIYSPAIRFSGTLQHDGSGGHPQVWAVKSSDCPTNPPTDIDLDLTVRAGAPVRSYGVIGSPTPRPSDPARVTLTLDQRSDGAPPDAGVEVLRGSAIRVVRDSGDRTCAVAGPDGSLPAGTARCDGPAGSR